MNWTIDHIKNQGFVKITCRGLYTVEGFLEMKKDLLEQPFWFAGQNLLCDYREVSLDGLKLEDLRLVAAEHMAENTQIGTGKMAFLMNSMRDFGRARQYELIAEAAVSSKIKVFRDEKEALDWLGSSSATQSMPAASREVRR